jgi:hypothetical protein
MASSSLPTVIAETIQTAHINRQPSPRHDLNPSTAASKKEPVTLRDAKPSDHESVDGDEDEEDEDEDVPYSVIRPKARSQSFPPMPDLRFEQSYLHSIAKADTYWKVAWITARDQVRTISPAYAVEGGGVGGPSSLPYELADGCWPPCRS